MAKTCQIRIRLSTKQKDKLEQKAKYEGYATLSSYIRDKLCANDDCNFLM